MLTGTWLVREKLLAGLFFLLLLLLLLPPPELTVLPPDTFLFRRLFGACLAGSATIRYIYIFSKCQQSLCEFTVSRSLADPCAGQCDLNRIYQRDVLNVEV